MHQLIKKFPFLRRWSIAIKILPLVLIISTLKAITHYYDFEFFELNSLFTAIISTNVFLIGFLITGVLSDYKESEKIPGDIASILETLSDEGVILYQNTKNQDAFNYLKDIEYLINDILKWFHKEVKTTILMGQISALNQHFLEFEKHTQANFISRLKQEQNNLRKIINRVHTIRETSFLGTGYAIVEIISFLLITGLIFINIDPSNANPDSFRDSMFFVFFVSFVLIYMINLIKDLDNPFAYYEEGNLVEDVSLKPLLETKNRLEKSIQGIKKLG
jgi:hypothetical protein